MGRDWGEPKRRRRSPMDTGNYRKRRCTCLAAAQAARQGRYQLARRYAAMTVRLLAGRP